METHTHTGIYSRRQLTRSTGGHDAHVLIEPLGQDFFDFLLHRPTIGALLDLKALKVGSIIGHSCAVAMCGQAVSSKSRNTHRRQKHGNKTASHIAGKSVLLSSESTDVFITAKWFLSLSLSLSSLVGGVGFFVSHRPSIMPSSFSPPYVLAHFSATECGTPLS